MLSFHLDELPKEGALQLSQVVDPVELDLPSPENQVSGKLLLSGEVVRTSKGARATGALNGILTRECVRCLNPYQDPVQIAFSGVYHTEDRTPRRAGSSQEKNPQHAAHGEEDRVGEEVTYLCQANRLDLGELLREELILATPIQPLCRPECRGLCPICGQDLNVQCCDCQTDLSNSPFQALRTQANRIQKHQPSIQEKTAQEQTNDLTA